jgi:hypothetical protein
LDARRYRRFLALIEQRSGVATQFRHSETPCFLPAPLIDKMARYGREMVEQLLADADYRRDSEAAIPSAIACPEAPVPLFVQADFGLDANLEPQLVEIQGFPSLYAYQPVMAECYRDAYGLDAGLAALPGGLNSRRISRLLRRAIVGEHDPGQRDPAGNRSRPIRRRSAISWSPSASSACAPWTCATCASRATASGTNATAARRPWSASTIAPSSTNWSAAPSRCPSISATIWKSNGPAIPTGSSA